MIHFNHKLLAYHFTDISPAFFEPARRELSTYNQKMTFQALDIEKDIDIQALGRSSYDLIIAANVLHITRHLASHLHNLRKFLKGGGKIIIARPPLAIMLMELETPMLKDSISHMIVEVQRFSRSSRRILRITGGGAGCKDPGHGLIDGFPRALMMLGTK